MTIPWFSTLHLLMMQSDTATPYLITIHISNIVYDQLFPCIIFTYFIPVSNISNHKTNIGHCGTASAHTLSLRDYMSVWDVCRSRICLLWLEPGSLVRACIRLGCRDCIFLSFLLLFWPFAVLFFLSSNSFTVLGDLVGKMQGMHSTGLWV